MKAFGRWYWFPAKIRHELEDNNTKRSQQQWLPALDQSKWLQLPTLNLHLASSWTVRTSVSSQATTRRLRSDQQSWQPRKGRKFRSREIYQGTYCEFWIFLEFETNCRPDFHLQGLLLMNLLVKRVQDVQQLTQQSRWLLSHYLPFQLRKSILNHLLSHYFPIQQSTLSHVYWVGLMRWRWKLRRLRMFRPQELKKDVQRSV